MGAEADDDQLFKELLTTFFFDFVELFLPNMRTYLDETPPVFLDKEVFSDLAAGERKEVDLVARVRFKNEDACFLIHVENQATPQSQFAKRMFHYFAVLTGIFDLPVYPVAIFSYESPQRAEPDCYILDFPDRRVLDFSYRVIQLNRLNWRDFLRQPNPVAAALMTKMQILPEDRPRVKLECMQMLARLRLDRARQYLITAFMNRYLKLNSDEFALYYKQVTGISELKRETVMEVMNEFEERAVHRVMMRQLLKRFGELPPDFLRRLQKLSSETLEDFVEASIDCATFSDVDAWLASHA